MCRYDHISVKYGGKFVNLHWRGTLGLIGMNLVDRVNVNLTSVFQVAICTS